MNETKQISNGQRGFGAKVLGSVLTGAGIVLFPAIVFPYVGTIVAIIGALLVYVGLSLCASVSKSDNEVK